MMVFFEWQLRRCFFVPMKWIISLVTIFFYMGSIWAQPMRSSNSAAILWEIEALANTASVLYIAAHPDDENTRLISYLANERQVRTAYLSLTRGDGGQNLIGGEKGPALGMVRSQELLAARRIDRGHQYFTRAYDFGYSKSPKETLAIWNKDSVLADIVNVIRSFQPDVIICRFPTTGEGGHGHHTASAILAEEAFDAAADASRFPEQLKYVKPWQAKRLVWNTFNFGARNTTAEDQLKLDVGGRSILLGKHNGAIAAESRSQHKSQGFGSLSSRGTQWEYFKHIKGTPANTDLFDGVITDWSRYPNSEEITQLLKFIRASYDIQQPAESLPLLQDLRDALQQCGQSTNTAKTICNEKLESVDKLILETAGIWFDVTALEGRVAPGQSIPVKLEIVTETDDVALLNWQIYQWDTLMNIKLPVGKINLWSTRFTVPEYTPLTSPFWLPTGPKGGLFNLADFHKNTLAANPQNILATLTLKIKEDSLQVVVPLQYKFADPVKGEQYQPLRVVPAVSLNLPQGGYLFTKVQEQNIPLTVEAHADNINRQLKVAAPAGWEAQLSNAAIQINRKGESQTVTLSLKPTQKAKKGMVSFFWNDEQEPAYTITEINYDHLPVQQWTQRAQLQVQYQEVNLTDKKIGYLPGADDEVASLLKTLGLDVEVLDKNNWQQSLQQYDAILTGVRAFNVNDQLLKDNSALMNFVERGGTLVVQYNTNSRAGPLKVEVGPYPFEITRSRVTDEDATVTMLHPQHELMNKPNAISNTDFNGWVQERGIYFAEQIDPKYTELFAMKDEGEPIHKGSTIIATYGKGKFIYTGLSFFRQLPAGVPGAYKLLINFLHW